MRPVASSRPGLAAIVRHADKVWIDWTDISSLHVELQSLRPAGFRGKPLLAALALFGRQAEPDRIFAAYAAAQRLPNGVAEPALGW